MKRRRRPVTSLGALVAALAIAACTAPPSVAPPVPMTTIHVPVPSRDKAEIDVAMDVLESRLRALGIGNFSAAAGDSLTFAFPTAGLPEAGVLEEVLHRRGVVAFLPWPAENAAPVEGDEVPAGMKSLVDSETGIRSAEVVDSSGGKAVKVVFTTDAAASIAEYTSLHVQGYMPVALDGEILMAPIIQGPITGGELLIQPAGDRPDALALAAILNSGPLPEGVIGR